MDIIVMSFCVRMLSFHLAGVTSQEQGCQIVVLHAHVQLSQILPGLFKVALPLGLHQQPGQSLLPHIPPALGNTSIFRHLFEGRSWHLAFMEPLLSTRH